MSVLNASILSGATWTPTGGSALVFASDGRSVPGGVSLVVPADTNLVLRRSLEVRAILPAYAANSNAFARMGKCTMLYRIPYVAADGKLYSQPVRIEASFHPDYATKSARMNEAIAFLADSDFTDFWLNSLIS